MQFLIQVKTPKGWSAFKLIPDDPSIDPVEYTTKTLKQSRGVKWRIIKTEVMWEGTISKEK